MKKNIAILLTTILMISMFTGCRKNKTENPPIEEKPPVSNEIENKEENKGENKEEKQPVSNEIENKEEKGKENKAEVSVKDKESEDQGMFLGMDDSNFVVIFSSLEKKDVHYKIAPSLNFKDSNIELGSAVKYRYTVSKTDEKTITHIEAVKP